MKIKGHSKIELRDIKTGKIEVYEDDNLVTNAMALYLQDLGMFNTTPLVINNSPIKADPLHQLMGGLLLFDTAISNPTADIIEVPSGIKMVGNGAYDATYDGRDGVRELGSWNGIESGWNQDGSYNMVWDFSSTQGNGTIACACLTASEHGWVGEGNSCGTPISYNSPDNRGTDYANLGDAADLWGYSATLKEIFEGRLLVHSSHSDSTMTFIDRDNIIYNAQAADAHMSVTGKIKLKTYKLPISKLDVRQSNPWNSSGGDEHIPVAETELTVPVGFKAAMSQKSPIHYCRHGKNYYIITDGGSNSGGWSGNWNFTNRTIHILKIEPDDTVSYLTAALPSGYEYVDLKNISFSDTDNIALPVYNTDSQATDRFQLWFQDMNNHADEAMISITDYIPEDYRSQGYAWTGAGAINRPDYGTAVISLITHSFKVDIDARTVYPLNQAGNSAMIISTCDDNPLIVSKFGEYARPIMQRTQGYLATINNLETPVTKDSSKTMKITYTVSFDDGE